MGTQMKTISDGSTTIFHGDCLEVMQASVPDGKVALIFADPPYNIGKTFGQFKDQWPSDEDYAGWCYAWLELCLRKLSATGSMYVMTSTQSMPYLDPVAAEALPRAVPHRVALRQFRRAGASVLRLDVRTDPVLRQRRK